MRACRIVGRGRFSSMLDMGGMSAAGKNEMKIDRGKNNKLRLVALDFDVITKSIQQTPPPPPQTNPIVKQEEIIPPADVQTIADLLQVELGQDGSVIRKKPKEDVSKILNSKDPSKSSIVIDGDIRTKYASKLRSKLDGGLAGVKLAKSEKERGDAATGHFAARQLALSQQPTSGKKWMATTGAGTLLTYLSNRSIQIALLPTTTSSSGEEVYQRMKDLTEQLPHVTFHLLVQSQPTVSDLLDTVSTHFEKDSGTTSLQSLVVSDRDEYLKCARDRGMYTCRLRPLNQPRGNVTTDYTVQTIAEVQEVVNDINGISFHTVVSMKQ